jgi:ABC-2 type transport system permease protein
VTARTAPAPALALAARARGMLGCEWTKLWSVRSTYWSLLAAAAASLGEAAAGSLVYATTPLKPPPPGGIRTFSLAVTFSGFQYAVLAAAVLGVLTFTAEQATGLIGTTFTAMPRRRVVLAAKAAVTGSVTLVTGEVLALASFGLSQLILAGHHRGLSVADPGVPRTVLGAGLLLPACAALGLGLGTLVRHTAGAIAAVFALLYLPVVLYLSLPGPWNDRILRFTLTGGALGALVPHRLAGLFPPGLSAVIALAWPAAALAAAAIAVTRRDV